MKSELIVCTRNRAHDVERLFESYLAQTLRPPVLFVDSSDEGCTSVLVKHMAERFPGIRYLRSRRGLTRQRMAGVENLAPGVDIVHFVDDDVVLEEDYFESIELAFVRHPAAVGAGGLITNHGQRNRWWWRRAFLLDSPVGGRVLRSGVNTLVLAAEKDVCVRWLSGCSMSYRRWLFDQISFDVRMEGYSIGEDVDFSYRAGFAGELWLASNARLAHVQSSAGREPLYRLARAEAVARHRRVAEIRGHGVSLEAFWLSIFGAMVLEGSRGIFRLSRYSLRRLMSLVLAVNDILQGGRIPQNPRLPARRS